MNRAIDVLIDHSHSMSYKIGETSISKSNLAKEILIEKFIPYFRPEDKIALKTFYFSDKEIRINELLQFGNHSKDTLTKKINLVKDPKGGTPIGPVIHRSIRKIIQFKEHSKVIILITDGEENIGGSKEDAQKYAIEVGIDCEFFIVAIDLTIQSERILQKLADDTNGHMVKIHDKKKAPGLGTQNKKVNYENLFSAIINCDIICHLIDRAIDLIRKLTKTLYEIFLPEKEKLAFFGEGVIDDGPRDLLVIEFTNPQKDLFNILNGIQYLHKFEGAVKKILIIIKSWTYKEVEPFMNYIKVFITNKVSYLSIKVLDNIELYNVRLDSNVSRVLGITFAKVWFYNVKQNLIKETINEIYHYSDEYNLIELMKEIISISAHFEGLLKDNRLNTIDKTYFEIAKSKIVSSLLDIIEKVSQQGYQIIKEPN